MADVGPDAWLFDIVREWTVDPRASDVLRAALDSGTEIGGLDFQRLLLKMTRRGLLRSGTLDAVLAVLGKRAKDE